MKQAINTRTQEEYDALMRYYESKGIKWESGDEATENDYWERGYKESTCIVENHEGDGLSFADISYWKHEGYTIIPYTEFAKTIEPDYKALYLEGRELLEKLSRISKDTGVAGSTWGDTDYDSLSAVFGYNLCLENIQWEIKTFLTKHNTPNN